MKWRRWTVVTSWILAAIVPLATAAAQQQDLPAVFSEVIDVRVVNVEVVVTDRQGDRVHGLKAADFELLVDGEPTPIEYFTEIEDGLAKETSNDVAAVPNLNANAHVPTNYLIYIDDVFSIQQDRDLVLTRLEEDLRELHSTDRVAAVAFDGKSMETLTDWTNSREDLAEALDRARSRSPNGLRRRSEAVMAARDRELRATLARLNRSASLIGIARRFAVTREDQLHRSVLAAVAATRRFGDQRGRKILLLLAGGWPESVALHASGGNLDAPPDPRMAMSADELYGPLVSAANLIGYTIYPVDVPGNVQGAAAQNERGTLQRLARATGGVPMTSFLRKVALARTVEDTRTYYWLGFEPTRREDDEFHEVEINIIGRTDLDVRTREGYVDMSRDREIALTVEATLLFGDPSDARPLDVHFSEPVRVRRGKVTVPIEVAIPLDQVALLPVAGLWQNELEVRVLVMDLNGIRADMSTEKIPIAGPEEPEPGEVFYYETELRLRRRVHTYVIAVYDPLTGTTMTSTGEVNPE